MKDNIMVRAYNKTFEKALKIVALYYQERDILKNLHVHGKTILKVI
jgi:hypothetical protein